MWKMNSCRICLEGKICDENKFVEDTKCIDSSKYCHNQQDENCPSYTGFKLNLPHIRERKVSWISMDHKIDLKIETNIWKNYTFYLKTIFSSWNISS